MTAAQPTTAQNRAPLLLERLGLPVVGRRVSDRYVTSPSPLPGVVYWATSTPRFGCDLFGVQFEGQGFKVLSRLRRALTDADFVERPVVDGRATYARRLAFGPDKKVDIPALQVAKQDADMILAAEPNIPNPATSFLKFMQASPLADVELDLPVRVVESYRPVSF